MMEVSLTKTGRPLDAPDDHAECRPELLLPDHNELARGAFERFLTGLGSRLRGCLGVSGEICYSGAQQGPSSTLFPDEPGACGAVLDLSPTPGQGLVVLSRNLASVALESLLGAPDDLESEGHESLTDLDVKLLDGFIGIISEELLKAWCPVTEASFQPIKCMAIGGTGKLDLPDQSVVVLSADLTIRGRVGSLHLVVPSLFVRLASKAAPAVTESGPVVSEADLLNRTLGSISVRVDAVLHGSDIRIRDLLKLKEGTVLMLPRPIGTPLEGQVNGVVKLRGSLISDGKSAGFEVVATPGANAGNPEHQA